MISDDVRKRYNVSDKVMMKLKDLESFDFDFLVKGFNDDLIRGGRPYSVEQVYPIVRQFGKADFEIAKLLSEEFRKFVALTLIKPGVPHAPPGSVDMFWHFFILHTEPYQEFCEDIWGNYQGDPRYRQHYPSTDDTRMGQFRAYAATYELYLDVFGPAPIYERFGASDVPVWVSVQIDGRTIGSDAFGGGSDTSGDSYSGIVETTDGNLPSYVPA